jgi:hypothetical protein
MAELWVWEPAYLAEFEWLKVLGFREISTTHWNVAESISLVGLGASKLEHIPSRLLATGYHVRQMRTSSQVSEQRLLVELESLTLSGFLPETNV